MTRGVDQVTVSNIANQAGIGKGTVYKHFLSKSQIMVRIALDYERHITENLNRGIQATLQGDPGAAAQAYFHARLDNPTLDRLVQQLELRLENTREVEGELNEIHSLRHRNIDALNTMVKELIERGILEDVPPHYHYLACWALAQGAVEVCFNKGYADQFDDKRGILDFISKIGVTMGNRGQLRDSLGEDKDA